MNVTKYKSIKLRFIVIFIVIFSILTLNSLWAVFNFKVLNTTVEKMLDSNYKSIVAAQKMIIVIERQDSFQLSYLSTKDKTYIDNFIKSSSQFYTFLEEAKNNITESGEKEVVASLEEFYNNYIEVFYKSLENPIIQDKFYFTQIFPVFEKIKSECKVLLELNQNAMIIKRQKADKTTKEASFFIIIINISISIIGIFIIIYLIRKVLWQFNIFIDKIKKVSLGDYSQRISGDMDKEFTELGIAFNHMSEQLNLYKKIDIEKILNEKSKAEAIVESINDGIIVTDMENNIILVNEAAEKIFNIKEKDVLNKSFFNSIKSQKIYESIQEILKNKNLKFSLKQMELSLNSNENKIYCKVFVNSILSKNNESLGIIILLQDITNLKEIEQMKDEFIATVSHEFKTPLTSIGMAVELLNNKNTLSKDKIQCDLIKIIKDETERLKYLINDLLDLSKLKVGKSPLKFEKCSLKKIILTSIKELKNFCENKKAKIILMDIDNSLQVLADFNKIVLVLNNLITNGIRYSKKNELPVINIKAMRKNNNIIVAVKDNGVGIPKDYLEKIFDKFTQVKVSTNDTIEGTGLGLFICSEIIKAHGGEIWVESISNKGSTFYFSLRTTLI